MPSLISSQVLGEGNVQALLATEHRLLPEGAIGLLERPEGGEFWRAKYRGVTDVVARPLERGQADGGMSELRVLRRIRHPNVTLFYGCMLSEGELYLVTELVHGIDFRAYVQQRRQDGTWQGNLIGCGKLYEQVLLSDVVHALHYLHSQDPLVLHRNVTPEAICVQTNRTPPCAKIVDFCLSCVLDGSEADGQVGCAAYLAPEVSSGSCAHSTAADLFAFGCLGAFVLTAEDPEPALVQARCRSLTAGAESWGTIREVALECLHEDPARRLTAKAAFRVLSPVT